MSTINLRVLFPSYELDCFVDVPDDDAEAFKASLTEETASVYFEFQRKENAYQRRVYWNKAHYSLNQGDGIENDAINATADPFEEYADKLTQQQLHAAIASLPEKQAKRVYAHYISGRSKAEIARSEGVDEKNVRQAIERGIIKMKSFLKNFSD